MVILHWSILQKYEYSHPGPSKNNDYSRDIRQFLMIILRQSMLQKYEYSHPGPGQKKGTWLAQACLCAKWLCAGLCAVRVYRRCRKRGHYSRTHTYHKAPCIIGNYHPLSCISCIIVCIMNYRLLLCVIVYCRVNLVCHVYRV